MDASRRRTPFVGRSDALGALDAALAAVEAGEPRCVEIAGPAGIGKTRLLAELGRRADARGHLVLTGAAAELEQDLPFWVWADALDEYVEGLDPRHLERLDAATRAALGQVLPALAGADAAPVPALHERHRTHRAMRELLERLAGAKPFVLVLDDVHWADPASADLLAFLVRRPPAAGVLLALGARPRQVPQRLAAALDRAQRAGALERLALAALSREEARALVGAGADALYEESGGNPFFLEQLARAPAGARAPGEPTALAGVDVPPMVAAALAEELSALSPPARRVLDGAAVAGDPFELDLAAVAAGVPEPAALDALDDLSRLELVRLTDMPRRFAFRHPIVRRAVYEAAPPGWRIGAHERLAAALEARGAPASARAHHVERCARHGDAAALATLRAAGRESAARAPATAAHWYAAALRLLPGDAAATERVELLLGRAEALIATGRFAEGHAALIESLELAPVSERALRTRLAAACARVEHLQGRHEDAHERLRRALAELPDEASPEGVALLIELTMDRLHRMRYPEMRAWGERAAQAAAQLDDPALQAAALAARARGAAVPGATADAEAHRDAAAALIDALPDAILARRLDALGTLAGAELYLHRFDDAHDHAERALAIGRATGQDQQFPLLYSILGAVWMIHGRLQEAVEPLDGAVEAARLTGNAQTLAWSLYPRAKIALRLGDVASAIGAAQEAVDLTDDGRPSHHLSHAAFALAEAQLEDGHPERGVDLLERSAGGPRMPLAAPTLRPFFLEVVVRCRLALGEVDAAAAAARAARESADAVGLPLALAWADRAAAAVVLQAGDAPRAAELALGAARAEAAGGAPVEAAFSQALAGRALAAAGRPDEAVAALERAAAAFERHGALRQRDAAEHELRRLGRRIHRRSGPAAGAGGGIEALTARELEIARRIVERQTNRQIAEGLFLSPKTVETHIRNLFAKLGADSRVEVARIVERADRLAGAAR